MQCFGLFGAELLQLRKTGSTEVFERQVPEKLMIIAANLWRFRFQPEEMFLYYVQTDNIMNSKILLNHAKPFEKPVHLLQCLP